MKLTIPPSSATVNETANHVLRDVTDFAKAFFTFEVSYGFF
jgi:hypothetical protein